MNAPSYTNNIVDNAEIMGQNNNLLIDVSMSMSIRKEEHAWAVSE